MMIRYPKRPGILAVVLVLAMAGAACKKNPAIFNAKTPAQRVAVCNGLLAESNRAATAAAIVLQKSGVLSRAQASKVLVYTERVAKSSDAVRVIQSGPGDWAGISPQILVILNQIAPPGDLGVWIGVPPAQMQLLADSLTTVNSLIRLMLAEVVK